MTEDRDIPDQEPAEGSRDVVDREWHRKLGREGRLAMMKETGRTPERQSRRHRNRRADLLS
ncbi:hypothetical protein [Rhodoplanes roseus]|uniref:hypothetical protein n=1 Tax=Rhodoplanes roseus TaxID=29409 RepID=UPI0011B800D3|nr:hypothetical protein [Rhodoplanes roseus]